MVFIAYEHMYKREKGCETAMANNQILLKVTLVYGSAHDYGTLFGKKTRAESGNGNRKREWRRIAGTESWPTCLKHPQNGMQGWQLLKYAPAAGEESGNRMRKGKWELGARAGILRCIRVRDETTNTILHPKPLTSNQGHYSACREHAIYINTFFI